MRTIGLDVHREFAEVAIIEDGRVRAGGRVETTPAALRLFAQSLAKTDEVAIEGRSTPSRSRACWTSAWRGS